MYGGTFNPPHMGHLAAAESCIRRLKLDTLLLMPAGQPPHKEIAAGSPTARQRLEMVELAATLVPGAQACGLELERAGKSYTADTMEELRKLPGVGRKTANLILGDVYHVPGVVVADTHCIRICGRLGFYPEDLKDPVKVEKIMAGYIEPCEQSDFCHRIVQFGRDTCIARSPQCGACPLSDICEGKR